jgi:hypothetical protein
MDPILSLLRHFCSTSGEAKTTLTIRLQGVGSRAEIPIMRSERAKTLFSGTCPSGGDSLRSIWRCEILEDAGRVIVDVHEQGVLMIHGARGLADGYFIDPESMHADAYESLFFYALAELLKRRGLFTLRAAALEYQGQGVLIAGGHGQGKTTACVSLLRSGFRYLSDDCPLLSEQDAQVDLLACPVKVEAVDRTIEMFAELREAAPGIVKQGVWKKWFQPEDIYPRSIGETCRPAMILFPVVSDMPHSCLEPLPKGRALERMMPQGLQPGNLAISRREFQALSKLVQQADCYRLHFGRNVLDLPDLVAPLLNLRKSA